MYTREGRKDDARRVMLEFVKPRDFSGGYPEDYIAQLRVSGQSAVARQLMELGYAADAVPIFNQAQTVAEAIPPDGPNYVGDRDGMIQQVREGLDQSLQGLAGEDLARTVSQFLDRGPSAGKAEAGKVKDGKEPAKPAAGKAEQAIDLVVLVYPRELDKAAVRSLFDESIRACASDAPRLAGVDERLSALRRDRPEDLSIPIASALTALAGGKPGPVDEALGKLDRALARSPLEPLPPGARAERAAAGRGAAADPALVRRPRLPAVDRRSRPGRPAGRDRARGGAAAVRQSLDAGDAPRAGPAGPRPGRPPGRRGELGPDARRHPRRRQEEGGSEALPSVATGTGSPPGRRRPPPGGTGPPHVVSGAGRAGPARSLRHHAAAACQPPPAPPATCRSSRSTGSSRRCRWPSWRRSTTSRPWPLVPSSSRSREALPSSSPSPNSRRNRVYMRRNGVLVQDEPADQIVPRVVARLVELEALWRRKGARPIACTRRSARWSCPRPGPPRSSSTPSRSARPRPCGRGAWGPCSPPGPSRRIRSTTWPGRSTRGSRSRSPSSPAGVLRAQLARAAHRDADLNAALGALAERLKKDTLRTTADLALHAALPALDRDETRKAALDLLEVAVRGFEGPDQSEPLATLLLLSARNRFKTGDVEGGRKRLAAYLDTMERGLGDYGGDYVLYQRARCSTATWPPSSPARGSGPTRSTGSAGSSTRPGTAAATRPRATSSASWSPNWRASRRRSTTRPSATGRCRPPRGRWSGCSRRSARSTPRLPSSRRAQAASAGGEVARERGPHQHGGRPDRRGPRGRDARHPGAGGPRRGREEDRERRRPLPAGRAGARQDRGDQGPPRGPAGRAGQGQRGPRRPVAEPPIEPAAAEAAGLPLARLPRRAGGPGRAAGRCPRPRRESARGPGRAGPAVLRPGGPGPAAPRPRDGPGSAASAPGRSPWDPRAGRPAGTPPPPEAPRPSCPRVPSGSPTRASWPTSPGPSRTSCCSTTR